MSEAIASSTPVAEPIRRSRRFLLILLSVLGIYSSLLSTVSFYREAQRRGRVPTRASPQPKLVWLGPGKPPENRVIGERKPIKGDTRKTLVSTRAFGSLFGQPLGLAWLAWFGSLLATLLLLPRLSQRLQQSIPVYIFVSSVVALSASFYVAFWMYSKKVTCLPCEANWIFSLAIFILSAQADSPPIAPVLKGCADDLRALVHRPIHTLLLAALPIALVFGAVWLGHRPIVASQQQWQSKAEFLEWLSTQPRLEVPADGEGAPVVLVKFHDYQCPPCRQKFFEYAPVLAKYEGVTPAKLTVINKDFPLDPECNPVITRPIHPLACRAAVAVRLARRNGRDRDLEGWLYRNQESLSRESIEQAAREVGGIKDFETLYPRERIALKADMSLAQSLSVRGTPTFFLNGIRLLPVSPDLLEAAIEFELARAGVAGRQGRRKVNEK